MRRPGLLAVVLAGLTAAIAIVLLTPGLRSDPDPAEEQGLLVGLVANSLAFLPDPARVQRRAAAAGAEALREELSPRDVEPLGPGQPWRWRDFDTVVLSAARLELRILPLLMGSPRDSGLDPLALPDPTDFARFTAAVVGRYGPNGSLWREHPEVDRRLAPRWFELWNEPYFRAFSRDGVDPARYATVFRAGAKAGREADEDARFLIAAENSGVVDGGRVPWIEPMFAAVGDLASWIDGLAIHPYSLRPPSTQRADGGDDFARIGDIVATFARFGVARAPVWLTEMGWSTCTDRTRCLSQAEQAAYLREMFDVLEARPEWRVEAVFIYHLDDQRQRAPDDREGGFGLYDREGRGKPALTVLRDVTRDGRPGA